MKLMKYLTLYDKILIVFIIVLSLTAIIFPVVHYINNDKSNAYIIIQSSNEIVREISISRTYRKEPIYVKINGPAGISIIEAHNGKVRMKKAAEGCPLKICEKTGWIAKAGPRIICVPNKVTVWIEAGENDIDGISR